MRFGKIDNFILFGGSQRLINFITIAKNLGFKKILVFSAPRLLSSRLSGYDMSLESCLKLKKIKYFSIEDINRFNIDKYIDGKTLGISFGAPWIFSNNFIRKFRGRLLNGHGTRLPKNRGGGGFSWQIMCGEKEGCHLFHLINEGIDTGDKIFFREFTFPKKCRIPQDYQDFFVSRETAFFRNFLKKIKSNYDFKQTAQEEKLSTYFPRLSSINHGFIDWSWKAQEIERFICAFDFPYSGASTFLDGRKVFLRGARKSKKEGYFHPFLRGLVYRKNKNFLFVAVSDGAILINQVYDEKGNDLLPVVKVGHRFVTPNNFLDKALLFRAVYDARGLKGRHHGFKE